MNKTVLRPCPHVFQRLRTALVLLIGLSLFFRCAPPPPSLTNLPEIIESVQGYASLKITAEGNAARSRFSFVFSHPDRAWIESTDILHRSLFQVVMAEGESYLVIPSKKVFWKGREEEIMNHLFGFPLNLREMSAMICGRWEKRLRSMSDTDEEWRLKRDASGRFVSGERGDVSFEIKEFIEKTPVARVFEFFSSGVEGRVKILRIDINSPLRHGLFSSSFTENFAELSWEQILDILNSGR